MKLRWLTIAMLLLSLAVVNWGLQYKMSLYKSSAGVEHAPAKLWTGSKDKAQATLASLSLEQQPPLIIQLSFLNLFIGLLLVIKDQRTLANFFQSHGDTSPWNHRLGQFQRSLFFLPPPALI